MHRLIITHSIYVQYVVVQDYIHQVRRNLWLFW